MSILQVAGGGFSVHRYGVADSSPYVYSTADAMASRGPYPLLIVADIVDDVPDAESVAREIVRGMALYLRHVPQDDPRQMLRTAFATANERVHAANIGRAGMRRLYLGLTCILLQEDELYVGQCAPSQVLVWQDGDLYTIPDLSTWSARDVTGTFTSLSFPLGFQRDAQPRVSYSRCAAGDVVAVVSWQLAKVLYDSGRLDQATDARTFQTTLASLNLDDRARHYHGGIYRIGSESSGLTQAGDTQDIGRLMSSHHANVFPHIGKLSGDSGSGQGYDFDTLGTGHSIDTATTNISDVNVQKDDASRRAIFLEVGYAPEVYAGPGSSTLVPSRHRPGTNKRLRNVAPGARQHSPPHARKGQTVELFAGLLLSLSAAVVGVWQVTKRDRPIHGPRDDGTLGLPHLQRWSDTYQPPRFERVRRVSPRFQIHGLVLAVVLVAAIAVAAVFAYGQFQSRTAEDLAGVEARLQEIATVRAQTDISVMNEANYDALSSAALALEELAASAPSDEVLESIHEEQMAIDAAILEMTSTEYLGNIQVLGSLPPGPDGVTARLFTGGGKIYVFNGALFELDQVANRLVQLISSGDQVGGESVGTLLAASWNEDRPIVVDSNFAYMRDPSDAQWHRVPLGVFSPEGFTGVTAAAAFNRNLYYLTADSGQILRFDALDYSMEPDDWASGSSREFLERGVDLLVDGNIHVVLDNGTLLTFFRSALERTLQPVVIPELESITAVTSIRESSYFFMMDSQSGRIIGMTSEGELFRQFVTHEGTTSLRGATDLAINESNGITYVVANNTLYAVRITLPDQ